MSVSFPVHLICLSAQQLSPRLRLAPCFPSGARARVWPVRHLGEGTEGGAPLHDPEGVGHLMFCTPHFILLQVLLGTEETKILFF